MTRYEVDENHQELLEYHGNTAVERIIREFGRTVRRDWLHFDSVEEAQQFFNDHSGYTCTVASC